MAELPEEEKPEQQPQRWREYVGAELHADWLAAREHLDQLAEEGDGE